MAKGWRRLAISATALAFSLTAAAGEPGRPRVMSLNVCTDQLVLALADPEQIVALSELATDPGLSASHEEAWRFPLNRGTAEEVLSARPEVIVTGVYSLHNTTQLLRGMGVAIEEFGYSPTLETIPGDIRRMGAALGRPEQAEALAGAFEKKLAELSRQPDAAAPTVIAYEQNGVALGSDTLAHSVLTAAGFRNRAAELGVVGMAPLPLELLVAERPDLVLLSPPMSHAPALADQFVRHPALRALGEGRAIVFDHTDKWACGGPSTIEALAALVAMRARLGEAGG